MIQREGSDAGFDADLGGDGEEVAGVVAGHVGDAADLALAPEELVVVELRHAVEVDGVDGDDAAFAQAGERADDHVSGGSEGDGAVERDGRAVVLGADPFRSELFGLPAVLLAAGGDVDLAVPVAENFDGERGGGSEAEEADALAGLGAGDAEAAKADDSGAEERGDLGVVECGGERVDEVGAGGDVLGVASVDGVAGEGGVVAEVLFVAEAEGAVSVGSGDPGDSDASALGEFVGCSFYGLAFDDLAYDLVAEDEVVAEGREVAFVDVEVGAADSAGEDAKDDVAGREFGARDVFDGEGGACGSRVEDGGFHGSWGLRVVRC